MEQKRLLLAFLLSAAILLGWTFFIQRTQPPQTNTNSDNANSAQQATNANTATPQQPNANQPAPQPQGQQTTATATTAPDTTPERTITITTPLYEVKLDSRGAVATSWIIKKNKLNGNNLYSVAGDKKNRKRLELIPSEQVEPNLPENLRQETRSTPLRLSLGDAALDSLLANRNYQIDSTSGDAVTLKQHEDQSVTMTLHDDATGLDVTKTFHFYADNYGLDLSSKVTRGGQPVPTVKLAIGPSIGDQG